MSTGLHVAALLLALALVPTVGAVTAWGLAGGDGEPDSVLQGILAAAVGFGCLYTALTCWTAFWGLPEWRWWATLVAPGAALLALAVVREPELRTARGLLTGFGLAVSLALPAFLLWAAGLVDLS